MPGNKKSRKRSTSRTPCPTQPLIDGAAKLAKAMAEHISGGCSTREEFCSIMQPAADLANLASGVLVTFRTCAKPLFHYLLTTHWKAVGHMLVALAWSAPSVVPGHTSFGMQPLEAPELWGHVADHCAKMFGMVLPALPNAQELGKEVLEGTQLYGLPAPQQWMATLAAALVATPDPCHDLMHLAQCLVLLWGACCQELGTPGPGTSAAGAWGLPAARHMQRLLQLLCARPGVAENADTHGLEQAFVGVVQAWGYCRRPALHPTQQRVCAVRLQEWDRHQGKGQQSLDSGPQQQQPLQEKQEDGQQAEHGQQHQQQQAKQDTGLGSQLGSVPSSEACQLETCAAGGVQGKLGLASQGQQEVEGPGANMTELVAGLALVQQQEFWWSLLATLCGLHHAWAPVGSGAGPVPRYHLLLAYPWYNAALALGRLKQQDSPLYTQRLVLGMCVSTLLQGWCWSLWPAQLQALDMFEQQAAAGAVAEAPGHGTTAAGGPRTDPLPGRSAVAMSTAADKTHRKASKPGDSSSSSSRWAKGDGIQDTDLGRDQQVAFSTNSSSISGASSSAESQVFVAVGSDSSSSSGGGGDDGDGRHSGTTPVQRLLWPLLPGDWSSIQPDTCHKGTTVQCLSGAPQQPEASSSSSSSSGSTQVVVPLHPTLQQLRVVLEAAVWEYQGQRLGGMWSGLLLLVILLPLADPLARMTFLAGVSGEVLLRLLGEVVAGEEGAAKPAAQAQARQNAANGCLMQWHTPAAGVGALGLEAVLAGLGRPGEAVAPCKAVLQVLLWSFFEVVLPQQQDTTSSSTGHSGTSSGSSSGPGSEQLQQGLVAAQRGAVWSSSQDPGLALPLLALPASWVRLVPGYTPSPLLALLLEQLGQGLGQEGEKAEEEGQQEQQQQDAITTSSTSFATTWWEVTLQVLAAAVQAGLQAADDPAPAIAAAAGGAGRRHLVPSPAALPFWAPLAALAGTFAGCSRQHLPQQQQQQRVAHLQSQLARAAALARRHPTGITTYAVADRSRAADPWPLREWVSDLFSRHTQLRQHVGQYSALCRRLAPLLPVLDMGVQGRQILEDFIGQVLLLDEGLNKFWGMYCVLLRTWELPAPQALDELMEIPGGTRYRPGPSDQQHQHQHQEQQQKQQQEQPLAAVLPGAAAGLKEASSRGDLPAGGSFGQDGPIPWLAPGVAVFVALMNTSDTASSLTQEQLMSRGMWARTQQQWVACRLAVRLMQAKDWYGQWCDAFRDNSTQMMGACSLRTPQLQSAEEQWEEEDDSEDADTTWWAQEPAVPSRRLEEAPPDAAQVLAAAQACFGSLQTAGQQLRALGEGCQEKLMGQHGSS